MPRCSTVPELEVPPGIVPSGMYVVVVDINGDSKMLARITGRGILYFDANDIFFATGDDDTPIILPDIPMVNDTMFGLLARTTNGRYLNLVNETDDEMTLRSKMGQLYFAKDELPTGEEDFLVPNEADGFGLLIRQPDSPEPAWWNPVGLIWIDPDKFVRQIGLGAEGQIIKMIGGVPMFATPSSGNVTAGSGLTSLEGVQAQNTSASQVAVTAPRLVLSDGSTTVQVANLNVIVNLASAAGLLGLDVGVEAANRWYYIYAISNGSLSSAVISLSDTAPSAANTPGYTFSALVGVFRNDSSLNIVPFVQKGRDFFTAEVNMSNNTTITTAYSAVPQEVAMNTIVPPSVKIVRGAMGGSTTASVSVSMVIAADSNGLGAHFIGSTSGASFSGTFNKDCGMFECPILDPLVPTLWWKGSVSENHRRISFTGYRI